MSLTRDNEFDLISRLFAPLSDVRRGFRPAPEIARGFHAQSFNLEDDVARLDLTDDRSQSLILTKDAIVAGVHFLPDDPPSSVAARLLGVNLSDLAAKAASPIGYLMFCGLPPTVDESRLTAFAAALEAIQKRFGFVLLGGDTTHTPNDLTLAAAFIGAVPKTCNLHRGAGRPGDRLYVSGTIGDAALGLQLQRQSLVVDRPDIRRPLIDRFLFPQPRLGLRTALREAAVAAIDISDGLIADLRRLAKASGVDIRLDLDAIPLSAAARALVAEKPQLWESILGGGDDYEIAAMVDPAKAADFERLAVKSGVCVVKVGDAVKATGGTGGTGRILHRSRNPDLAKAARSPQAQSGYRHF